MGWGKRHESEQWDRIGCEGMKMRCEDIGRDGIGWGAKGKHAKAWGVIDYPLG